jgi:hypothetical protein
MSSSASLSVSFTVLIVLVIFVPLAVRCSG